MKVTAKVSKLLMDKTIGTGTLSTDYAGQGGQTVSLIDEDGKTVGQVQMANMQFRLPCVRMAGHCSNCHTITINIPQYCV